ncbi:response regulator [Paenibacillus andongensis]|uniref:response regulator n=1 Tax=Paenibacillus andongensis TaxID=2975482 RepID=UPI0021BAE69C|nr:response regulator [Paenibacillus andongensis]
MSKIRMILADDEPVILRGLRMIIDWDELGIEIVGAACDGNELLALLESCEPDLIVSDICMPGLSGIDVLRHIEASERTTKVVFISAYKEFSYAQDALKYGALDYLVKPVNTAQLEQVIQKAVSLIRDSSEEERTREKLEHLERNIRDKTIEELLDRLMDGDEKAGQTLSETVNLRARKNATVCVGEWKKLLEDEGRWQEQERKLIDFAITNVMREIMQNNSDCFFFRKGHAFCFLILNDHSDMPLQAAKEVRDKVKSYLKLNMTIGVGGAVSHIQQAVTSYKQALEALEWAYFHGPGNVIPYQTAPMDSVVQLSVSEMQLNFIHEIVTASSGDVLYNALSELLKAIQQEAFGNKHTAVSTVYTMLMMIRQELRNMDIAIEGLNDQFQVLLERINGFGNFTEVEEYTHKLIAEIHLLVKVKLGNKEQMQITQVKEYIDEHYAENITLEKIAALIYMNPSYFSTFFKKHTDENFKHYLTEVRMKHARRLLLHSNLMVYEVAEKVGYNSARLFSEMFRKWFGQLPQDYKHLKGTQTDELHT